MTRYLITGSTGWFGRWLVPYLERQGHTVFPESRRRHAPLGRFEYIIHCSRGPAADYLKYREDGGEMLVCSSGAVVHSPRTEYAHSKRMDESLPGVKIARCYSFISHDTPLDYAAGRYLTESPIIVRGSGNHIRGYMHMSDLCEWLTTILHSGKRGVPYNVGSSYPVNMRRLADLIAKERGVKWHVDYAADQGVPTYIPNTTLARDTLGLRVKLKLEGAIRESVFPSR